MYGVGNPLVSHKTKGSITAGLPLFKKAKKICRTLLLPAELDLLEVT